MTSALVKKSALTPRLWRGVNRLVLHGGQLVLAFMAITIFYDAIMRHFFSMPTSWSLEINQFLLVYLGLATAGEIQRNQSHIHIEFFADRLPVRFRFGLEILIRLIGVAFCAVLAWRGGVIAWQAGEYGERVSSAFGTPLVLPYAIIPLGFGLLGIQFLIEAGQKIHFLVTGTIESGESDNTHVIEQ
jgi:TRAP-type C4-dicarboxylate transport system permease small subunit